MKHTTHKYTLPYSTKMTPSTLNENDMKLPLEVLEQIFTWSECDRSASDTTLLHSIENDPDDLNSNDEYPCFKSFRMVCKVWNSLATTLLFKSIILLPNIDSWRNLQNICTTPHLAQHVRNIRLATHRHLRQFSTLNEWDREVCFGFSRLSTINGGPRSYLPGDHESYFVRYESWYASELELRAQWSDNTAPELSLNQLPHLERVETIGHRELATIKMKIRRSSVRTQVYWRSFTNRTRREVQTLVEDVYPADGDFDNASPIPGFRHLDVFSTALRNNNVSLPTFAVRSTLELIGGDNDEHTGLLPGL